MQIINTFAQVLRFWEMGMPSRLLLPVTFLLFAAFHGFLRWGTGTKRSGSNRKRGCRTSKQTSSAFFKAAFSEGGFGEACV